MCLGCLDEPQSRRTFIVGALQLAAASTLADAAAAATTATVLDIQAQELFIEHDGVQLPACLAVPIGTDRQAIVVMLVEGTDSSRTLFDMARDAARTGYLSLAVDVGRRAGEAASADVLFSEALYAQLQEDVRAVIAAVNGELPTASPVVLMGLQASMGYLALRMALADPLNVVGVVVVSTPIETSRRSRLDPRPDLITLLARLNVPVQFHVGTDDAEVTRAQLNWLGQFVAVEPSRRELFVYTGAKADFYLPFASGYDKGYQMAVRRRWQDLLLRHIS